MRGPTKTAYSCRGLPLQGQRGRVERDKLWSMLSQHGPVPEISITFDPGTRCYGFSTRLPGMRPHWVIDTFESLETVMLWVDPWQERIWMEASDADEDRILVSRERKVGAI